MSNVGSAGQCQEQRQVAGLKAFEQLILFGLSLIMSDSNPQIEDKPRPLIGGQKDIDAIGAT